MCVSWIALFAKHWAPPEKKTCPDCIERIPQILRTVSVNGFAVLIQKKNTASEITVRDSEEDKSRVFVAAIHHGKIIRSVISWEQQAAPE